jgi:hypothetical protein
MGDVLDGLGEPEHDPEKWIRFSKKIMLKRFAFVAWENRFALFRIMVLRLRDGLLRTDCTAADAIQAPKLEPRIMRREFSEYEWIAIKLEGGSLSRRPCYYLTGILLAGMLQAVFAAEPGAGLADKAVARRVVSRPLPWSPGWTDAATP